MDREEEYEGSAEQRPEKQEASLRAAAQGRREAAARRQQLAAHEDNSEDEEEDEQEEEEDNDEEEEEDEEAEPEAEADAEVRRTASTFISHLGSVLSARAAEMLCAADKRRINRAAHGETVYAPPPRLSECKEHCRALCFYSRC